VLIFFLKKNPLSGPAGPPQSFSAGPAESKEYQYSHAFRTGAISKKMGGNFFLKKP